MEKSKKLNAKKILITMGAVSCMALTLAGINASAKMAYNEKRTMYIQALHEDYITAFFVGTKSTKVVDVLGSYPEMLTNNYGKKYGHSNNVVKVTIFGQSKVKKAVHFTEEEDSPNSKSLNLGTYKSKKGTTQYYATYDHDWAADTAENKKRKKPLKEYSSSGLKVTAQIYRQW